LKNGTGRGRLNASLSVIFNNPAPIIVSAKSHASRFHFRIAKRTTTKIVPSLAIDMMEVGESTGALPQMLSSVADFYEEDVSTRMTALLSLIEPAIMIFMGMFVAFVLVALYLPIFSLADTIR